MLNSHSTAKPTKMLRKPPSNAAMLTATSRRQRAANSTTALSKATPSSGPTPGNGATVVAMLELHHHAGLGDRRLDVRLLAEDRGEGRRGLRIGVHDVRPRRGAEVAEPAQQLVLVGVRGKSIDVLDVCVDRYVHAHDAHVLVARPQQSSDGPRALKTDEADGVIRARQSIAQMVQDPATAGHAARSDDDRVARQVVERDGIGALGDVGDVAGAYAGVTRSEARPQIEARRLRMTLHD